MLSKSFELFLEDLQIDNRQDIETKFKSITKRLNTKYYGTNSDIDHAAMVGSIGRSTAIRNVSDLDMLFVLPQSVFNRFDNYESNGQKALLQEVKQEIKERYPHNSTIVRGDGQVVVVSFSNFEVEICPAFENKDGSFCYPDSNNGGSWKRTDPLVEIGESDYMISETNSNFKYVCQILRAWKNNIGVKMGGLLIDTLVHKFFHKNKKYFSITFDNYLELLIDLFGYLKGLDEEQKYWQAIGSKQHVYNKDKRFIKKAGKAYKKLKESNSNSDDLYIVLKELFGNNFPVVDSFKSNQLRYSTYYSPTEQFIENMFPVDIRYRLIIDCEIKQNGFRETMLKKLLRLKKPLLTNKELTFFIDYNEVEEKELSYEIYWKVKNQGEEAVKRGQLRGEIKKGGNKKIERTNFRGFHFVECYIIHSGICVARDFISVPIATHMAIRI
ncbi:SMODS domain-containing nucleotidyltransferase [Bacillus subtilis]|uniref:SMODS domain-containing nucleotidyltransferase n=1 Tax=Bacillus subtilis TaxID=1423 RepID=UPI000935075C|nr:nucleotidyltransferase [Bacillus subtilis]MDR4182255.1 nucleotidyltransferase [Bacillus subtilis]URM16721.1 nucleotidyltransferase [Bacillus subtilis]UXM89262.1 nucleotidyltransferase [Bacillus subtilis]